ncbi:DUF2382 domain-containing protein [Pantanalinema sp. GBBB05]|uniref:DUF2382 domain-containing protein n=1 Tax=Pantanalinema sp. GBBB05 TaxID=2604139 RepID=UPI001DF1EB82|nr:DUF2382 domain-containing protein [Pantanalinema sp. GBBB05]
MSHQPSVMPSGPTEPDADRLRILLDNLNNLRSRLKSFAVIDKQGQPIGQVQDLILDAGHQLNLVIAQPDAPENGHSFLLDGRQIQKVSVQAQSVFVDITQSEVGSLPPYQTYQPPEETSPTASEIEDLFADTPEQPELIVAAEPSDLGAIAALDEIGDLPEPESPATDSFGDSDLNTLELEATPSAIEEEVSFAELTADQSPSDSLEEFSFSSLVADQSAEDLSNLDLGTLNATEQLTGADFGDDLELADLSFTADSLTATPEFPEATAFSESLDNLDLPLDNLDLSSESSISDDFAGLDDLELPVTEPPRDEDTGFSELLVTNESPEPSLDLDLSELNGSSDFGLAIDDSMTEESLVDDLNFGASFTSEASTDNALEFNLEDTEPSFELESFTPDTNLNLDLDQDSDFDLNLEDTGGLADLELPANDEINGLSLDESLLAEPASEAAIDLTLLDESEPLDLGLETSTSDLDLDLEPPTAETGFDLELAESTDALDLGFAESTPDLDLELAASDDLADLSFASPGTESGFDLGLAESTDALDLDLAESTSDLDLNLESPTTEPGFDFELEEPTPDLDLNLASPTTEPGFDFELEEPTPDLDLNLESPTTTTEPGFDLDLASTDALDLGLEPSAPDLDLNLESPTPEAGFDFGLEEPTPDLDLNLESHTPEPGFDLDLASTDALDLGLEPSAPDLDLNLESPAAEAGFNFGLEEPTPDLDLESPTPEPGFDLDLASTGALDLGLEPSAPDLDLNLESPTTEPGFDFGLEEPTPDLDLNLESPTTEPGFDFGLEEPTPDLDLNLESPTPEPEFDLDLASTDALDLGLEPSAPDLDLNLESPTTEPGFDFGLEEPTPDLDLNLESPTTEPGFDLDLASTDALDLELEPSAPDPDLNLEPSATEAGFDFGLEEPTPDLDLNLESPATEAGFDFGLEEPTPDLDFNLESSVEEPGFNLGLAESEPELSLNLESLEEPGFVDLGSVESSPDLLDFNVDQTNNLTSFEPALTAELPEIDNLSALDLAFSEPSGTFSTEDLGDIAAGTAIAGLGVAATNAFAPVPESQPDDRAIPAADLSPVTADIGDESTYSDATIPPEALISPDTIIPPDTVQPDTVDEAIELLEERLKVDYKRRKIGDVIIRKQIETRMIQVPVRYEKLVIEQVSPEQKPLAEVDLTEGQPINVELPDIMGQPTISGEFESPKAANYVLSAITKTLHHRCKKVRVEIELEDDTLQQSYQEWLDRCIDILKNS